MRSLWFLSEYISYFHMSRRHLQKVSSKRFPFLAQNRVSRGNMDQMPFMICFNIVQTCTYCMYVYHAKICSSPLCVFTPCNLGSLLRNTQQKSLLVHFIFILESEKKINIKGLTNIQLFDSSNKICKIFFSLSPYSNISSFSSFASLSWICVQGNLRLRRLLLPPLHHP